MSNVSMVDGHIDKEPKFTDEEIIESFNHCLNSTDGNCGLCIFKGVVCDRSLGGKIETLKLVADVLNRQQAEIERLKKGWKADVIETENIKAEAIKEFAEMLKEALPMECRNVVEGNDMEGITDTGFQKEDTITTIDNLVKEMVGEE